MKETGYIKLKWKCYILILNEKVLNKIGNERFVPDNNMLFLKSLPNLDVHLAYMFSINVSSDGQSLCFRLDEHLQQELVLCVGLYLILY